MTLNIKVLNALDQTFEGICMNYQVKKIKNKIGEDYSNIFLSLSFY